MSTATATDIPINVRDPYLVQMIVTNNQRGIYLATIETILGNDGIPLLPRAQELFCEQIRHCYSYTIDQNNQIDRGYGSLAVDGPYKGSRISPASTSAMVLSQVNKVILATPEAVKTFAKQGWEVPTKKGEIQNPGPIWQESIEKLPDINLPDGQVWVEVILCNNQRGIYLAIVPMEIEVHPRFGVRPQLVRPDKGCLWTAGFRHVYNYGTDGKDNYHKGYLSLPEIGPVADSRIGPMTPPTLFREVNKYIPITPKASAAFARQGWATRLDKPYAPFKTWQNSQELRASYGAP